MPRLSRLIENLANVAIVVTCGVLLVTLGSRAFADKKPSPASALRSGILKTGDPFPRTVIDGNYFQGAKRNLLMYVRSGCRYCDESGPFYERLAADGRLREANAARLAVLTTDTADVVRTYTSAHGLSSAPIWRLERNAVPDLRLPGTPALVLVDATGVVQKVWLGKLDERGEQDVLAALFPETRTGSQ